ncbi:hypothetical protein FDECE_7137 [Fusarium decemcellulare]|nr:hypothetical protein FDECE_7137 [Fusarium decemcellulare]
MSKRPPLSIETRNGQSLIVLKRVPLPKTGFRFAWVLPLAPLVQKYIDDDLAIKIKILDLRFTDDGALTGVAQDSSDIFANVKERASTPPDVLVGPDSNCRLLFTSGTQDMPKGVFGRHYSLAKYFPWMAEKFGLSSESVFACLSGIAHDPIQRGISAGAVEKDQEQNALMPLFHMATANLSSTTRAPELGDRNTMAILRDDTDR